MCNQETGRGIGCGTHSIAEDFLVPLCDTTNETDNKIVQIKAFDLNNLTTFNICDIKFKNFIFQEIHNDKIIIGYLTS